MIKEELIMNKLNLYQLIRENSKIYILQENARDVKILAKLPGVKIKYITRIEEYDRDGILLIKKWNDDFLDMNRQGIKIDFLQHWITGDVNLELLKYLNLNEYIDVNDNKIIIDNNASSAVIIRRNVRRGEIIAKHNCVRLGKVKIIAGNICISFSGNKSYVRIGDETTTKGLSIGVGSKGKVIIGEDVMMARNIGIWQSDGHHIFDKDTGERINYTKDIYVGNHVWLGRNVSLLGGVSYTKRMYCGSLWRDITSF